MSLVLKPPVLAPMSGPSLFLAGGITGCPDWQAYAIEVLSGTPGTLLCPRVDDFDVTDPDAARAQITWEYNALQVANAILFWFPAESIQPIALFELGTWAGRKPTVIGRHPDYPRGEDVDVQMSLRLPGYRPLDSLDDVLAIAKRYLGDEPF